MKKGFKYKVNIDKLRLCYKMPVNLYEYLKEHYTRHDSLNNTRILEEDNFNLVFIDEDENKMTAILNVKDIDGYFKLGTFSFSNSAKYEGKAFFTFENSALYRIYAKTHTGEPTNCICNIQYVADYYGMDFNNITELEIAFDSTFNYITKIRKMIKDIDTYDLYRNGKKVKDDETLDGYGEYYTRNRIKLLKSPTLYCSQAKKTDMKMRIYDKKRELNKKSPHKCELLKEWLGWDSINKLYRIEVVLHNTNVREFTERCGSKLLEEWGAHDNILNLLGIPNFLLAMFLDSVDRLIYFRNKKTREQISIVDVAGI